MAVSRARATGSKAIFWLNPARAHDANVIGLANKYLADHDVAGKYSTFLSSYKFKKRSFKGITIFKTSLNITVHMLNTWLLMYLDKNKYNI